VRVTDNHLFDRYREAFGSNRTQLDRALRALADGKRVRHASDDPAGAATALELRARLVRLEAFDRSAAAARLDLQTLDDTLGRAVELVSQARTKALAGATTSNLGGAEALALEIDALRAQMLDLANTVQKGRHLFAGTETLTPPFDAAGSYSGDDAEAAAPIGDAQTVGTTLSGQRVFVDGGDVLATLESLAAALRAEDTAAVAALVAPLGAQLAHLGAVRADVGTRLQRIEAEFDRHGEERLRSQTRIAQIEDISLEQVVFEIRALEDSQEALAATAARVLGRSLFDVLG
jgi:flagellar hook-associated protein 3 FlgL